MSHEGDETGRGQKNRKLVSQTGSSYDSDCLHLVWKEKKRKFMFCILAEIQQNAIK